MNYVSVKISSIFSQINLVAREATLEAIKERLRKLYRAALPDKKFVNLDMEEYRDLALTVAAFRGVLDEEEFRDLPAGLVLQAYLPDSIAVQRELTGVGAEARGGGRRADQDPAREGREPRDGDGGGRAARLECGSAPLQARHRRVFPADAGVRLPAGERGGGAGRSWQS